MTNDQTGIDPAKEEVTAPDVTPENNDAAARPPQKKPRKPFAAAKPLSVLLSILLTVSLLASVTLGIFHATFSREGLTKIVSAFDIGAILRSLSGGAPVNDQAKLDTDDDGAYALAASAPGLSEGLEEALGKLASGDFDAVADYVTEVCGEDLLEELNMTRDDIKEIIGDPEVKEYVTEKLTSMTEDFIINGEAMKIDADSIVAIVRDNADMIRSVTGYEITEDQLSELKSKFAGQDISFEFSTADIKNATGFDIEPIMKLFSPELYITAIAVSVVIAVLIFALHKFLIGKSLSYVTVPAILVGIVLFIVAACLYFGARIVLDGALTPVLGVMNEPIVLRAVCCLGAGIVLSIVAIPLKRHNI